MITQTGHVIMYSEKEERQEYGVAIVMNNEAARLLISWKPIGERNHNPDSDANKDEFYEQLQSVYNETPKHDTVISMGDWNAKLGQQMPGVEGIIPS